MKKDKEITKVLFVMEENPASVLAVFPELKDDPNYVKCYSHLGQHSKAWTGYYKQLSIVSKGEYTPLYDELTSLGYNLHVLNDNEPTKEFKVTWEIDVSAQSPRNAAIKALLILLDLNRPWNQATVFEVNNSLYDLQELKNGILSKEITIKDADL